MRCQQRFKARGSVPEEIGLDNVRAACPTCTFEHAQTQRSRSRRAVRPDACITKLGLSPRSEAPIPGIDPFSRACLPPIRERAISWSCCCNYQSVEHNLGSHCFDSLSTDETESSLLGAEGHKMSCSGETEVGIGHDSKGYMCELGRWGDLVTDMDEYLAFKMSRAARSQHPEVARSMLISTAKSL